MLISDLSVKRPVFAFVVNALLVVFGIISFSKLPLRQTPDIDPPVVGIETSYRGASAEIVDTKITRVLEDRLSGIESIRYIDSVSRDGRSEITIEFELSRDIEAAVNDVRQAVSRSVDDLPEEVDPPEVAKADANARPIMWFNLSSTRMNSLELTDYARRVLVDRLTIVDGVARVIVGGSRDYAMRILLDRKALAARSLTVNDIEAALRAENVELPAGSIESVAREFTARINRAYQTEEDFAGLVIGEGDDGHLIRLGEVARIEFGARDDKTSFRRNGNEMVGIGIVKQSQANTVEVVRLSKEAVDRMKPLLPAGTRLEDSYDSSIFVDGAIKQVYLTLGLALSLVVLVIFLFLGNLRATLIPAITVPVSLVAAFIFVYAMGFSINILTLLALVLAIGLVVDDSIVVLENIYRRIEHGEPPLLAAYRGARQVGFAVIATTLVLIAVFVPLIFLEGNVGRLFSEFALTTAAAVGFSSLVALSLSPMVCSRVLRKSDHTRLTGFLDRLFERVEDVYERSLKTSASHVGYGAVILLLSVGLIAALLNVLPKEFAPQEDTGSLFMIIEGPEGNSFEQTRKSVDEIESLLLAKSGELGIDRLLIRVPGFGSNALNTGIGIIGLVDWGERELSGGEIRNRMQQYVSDIPGVRTFVMMPQGLTRGRLAPPVEVVVGADTYRELAEWRRVLLEEIANNPNLQDVDVDFKLNAPQIAIDVDRQRAADLGVSVNNIGRSLETILGSRVITTFMDRGEEYDVVLEGWEADYRSPDDLENIYVRSERSGRLIPLANLVTISEKAVSKDLPRFNRRRALTLTAYPAPGYTLQEALNYVQSVVMEKLPATASLDYKGESLEFINARGSVIFVFAIALLIAYLVLAAQFESFLHPSIILLTVPLALGGALLGLYFTGQSLNIYSQIGIVMLIGLAAKNGILIVEFANQLRDAGMAFEDALIRSARQRLRPIMMTSMTTVMGSVPLLLATGPGAESRFVLGVVVFFGVSVATFLTLFVVPSAYLLLARNSSTPGKLARHIRVLESEETSS